MPTIDIDGNFPRLECDITIDEYRYGMALTHAGVPPEEQERYALKISALGQFATVKTYDLRSTLQAEGSGVLWATTGLKDPWGKINTIIELPIDETPAHKLPAERMVFGRAIRDESTGIVDATGLSMLLSYGAAQARYLIAQTDTPRKNPNKINRFSPLAIGGYAALIGGAILFAKGFTHSISEIGHAALPGGGSNIPHHELGPFEFEDAAMMFGGLAVLSGGGAVAAYANARNTSRLPMNIAARGYMDSCVELESDERSRNPWADVVDYQPRNN